MKSAITTVDLLRHGQVEADGQFCAPGDASLSEAGWQQMQAVTRNGSWQAMFSSPSRRCESFASYLSDSQDCECNIVDALRELDFGDWIGLSSEQIWQQAPELLNLLWYQPLQFSAPGGESMLEFIERIRQAWQQLISDCKGQRILLVTHAGTIRVILSIVLDIAYEKTLGFEIDTAQLSRIRIFDDGAATLQCHGLKG